MRRRGKGVGAIMKVVKYFVVALNTQLDDLTKRGLAASARALLERSTSTHLWPTWNLADFNIRERVTAFAEIGRDDQG